MNKQFIKFAGIGLGLFVLFIFIGGTHSFLNVQSFFGSLFTIVRPITLNESAITVTSPSNGSVWAIGQTVTVSWNRNFIPRDGEAKVGIYLRKGNGTNIPFGGGVPDSSYSIALPSIFTPGDDYHIVVGSHGTGEQLWDESDGVLSIIDPSVTPAIIVTSPNNGDSWVIGQKQIISWKRNFIPENGDGGKVGIYLRKGNGPNVPIGGGVPDSSFVFLPSSTLIPGDDYHILVSSHGTSPLLSDESDGTFSIIDIKPTYTPICLECSPRPTITPTPTPTPTPPVLPITVLLPNGGETWEVGSLQTIKWNPVSGYNYVLADLVRGSNNTYVKSISVGNSMLTGQFTWQIPKDIPSANDYKIYINASNVVGKYTINSDFSDNYFSIVGATSTPIPPPVPTTATILGRVWYDENGDGIKDGFVKEVSNDCSGLSFDDLSIRILRLDARVSDYVDVYYDADLDKCNSDGPYYEQKVSMENWLVSIPIIPSGWKLITPNKILVSAEELNDGIEHIWFGIQEIQETTSTPIPVGLNFSIAPGSGEIHLNIGMQNVEGATFILSGKGEGFFIEKIGFYAQGEGFSNIKNWTMRYKDIYGDNQKVSGVSSSQGNVGFSTDFSRRPYVPENGSLRITLSFDLKTKEEGAMLGSFIVHSDPSAFRAVGAKTSNIITSVNDVSSPNVYIESRPTTATILGRVWYDENGDGIKDGFVKTDMGTINENCLGLNLDVGSNQNIINIIQKSSGQLIGVNIDRCNDGGSYYEKEVTVEDWDIKALAPLGWKLISPNPVSVSASQLSDGVEHVWFGIQKIDPSIKPTQTPTCLACPTPSPTPIPIPIPAPLPVVSSPLSCVLNWGVYGVAGVRSIGQPANVTIFVKGIIPNGRVTLRNTKLGGPNPALSKEYQVGADGILSYTDTTVITSPTYAPGPYIVDAVDTTNISTALTSKVTCSPGFSIAQ